MTLEGEGPDQDDTPAPPARTRWSEDAGEDEPGIMPPYVPGARTPRAERPEPAPASAPSGSPAPDRASDFPLDTPPEDEELPLLESPVRESRVGEERGEVVEQGEDFPFNAFDIEQGGDEGLADAGSTVEAEPAGVEPQFGTSLEEERTMPSSADEVAGQLERLADALRRDGRIAVERELGAGDRLTSLVAGVVAGYLAGLDD